jgi:competence protein ComEC
MWRNGSRTPALAALLLAAALVATPPVFPDRRLRITVLDVGQADCIVIQTPGGHTLLVDAGGRLERGAGSESTAEQVGERVVVPFLRRAGVKRIDALILSHPHGDHAGGSPVALRNFPVGEFADSGQRYGGYAYNDALQTAHAEHVPIVYPRAGAVWRTNDGVTLTFIGPSLPYIKSSNTINDNSIAFILQYKHFRMLFTGDAGVVAEQRFLNEGIDLHADVLKVGHHGSAYSSSPEFIAAVHPRYAIISVGRHNLFGHPAPSTLETLQRFGVRIYRTDENGASTILGDGQTFCITTMLLVFQSCVRLNSRNGGLSAVATMQGIQGTLPDYFRKPWSRRRRQ